MDRQPDGKFAPGNCANPHGRPRKGHTVAGIITKFMRSGRCRELAEALFHQAVKEGSVASARLIVDAATTFELEERLAKLEAKAAEAERKGTP